MGDVAYLEYEYDSLEQKKMIKQSHLIFKDLKNIRRSTAMLSHSTSKDMIASSKDIRNVRSTKQIDVTTYIQNKNDKIKTIDAKLEVHQSEINKNNNIIEELNHNFAQLREQLERQREATQNQERKNKLLREEIQRTNKILRVKNSKIEESNKKITDLEKQNEQLRSATAKNQEYSKTINTLRGKLAQNEESLLELRSTLNQKEKETQRQKEKIMSYQNLRAKEEDLNSQLLTKDILIGNLKQAINQLQQEKSKEVNEKNSFERKVERLTEEIQILKSSQKGLNATISSLEKKYQQSKSEYKQLQSEVKSGDNKLKDKEREQLSLRRQCSEVREKYNQMCAKNEEQAKQMSKRDVKIQRLTQKVRDLENNIGDTYKDKEKLRSFEEKIGALKKKGQNLQSVYYSIVPQIQCPFGHELQNPVTIIPCGHNYCLGCKKGYQKECMQCCGKLKIEAVYRNELMDDIIGMVTGIRQVMQLLK